MQPDRDPAVPSMAVLSVNEAAARQADGSGTLLVDVRERTELVELRPVGSVLLPMSELPAALSEFPVGLEDEGHTLRYRGGDGTGKGKREIAEMLRLLVRHDIAFEEVDTRESTLEDIFVDLVEGREGAAA